MSFSFLVWEMGVRVILSLEVKKEIALDCYWRNDIQKEIYRSMRGYPFSRIIHSIKQPKFFTFSLIKGARQELDEEKACKRLVFKNGELTLSFYDDFLGKIVLKNLLEKGFIRICGAKVKITGVREGTEVDFSRLARRKMIHAYTISPINVQDARGFDIAPESPYFSERLFEQLKRMMYNLLYPESELKKVSVGFLINTQQTTKHCYLFRSVNSERGRIDEFSKCGYMFDFLIIRNNTLKGLFEEVLKVMYYAGVGHNTSKGFGMINYNLKNHTEM